MEEYLLQYTVDRLIKGPIQIGSCEIFMTTER